MLPTKETTAATKKENHPPPSRIVAALTGESPLVDGGAAVRA